MSKALHFTSLNITAGFNKKFKYWNVQVSSRRALVFGQVQLWWYPRNLFQVNHQDVGCVLISGKANELQPKMKRADKNTNMQGNLSLIPLP